MLAGRSIPGHGDGRRWPLAVGSVADGPRPELEASASGGEPTVVKPSISRPLSLAVAGFLTILGLGLVLNGVLTFRAERRLESMSAHVRQMQSFQTEFLHLEHVAVDRLTRDGGVAGEEPGSDFAAYLDRVIDLGEPIDPDTPARLSEVQRLLESTEPDSGTVLTDLLRLSRDITDAETREQRRLLDETTRDIRTELRLEVGALTLLLGLGATIVLSTRRKIFQPLRSLETLLSRLAQGELAPIPVGPVEPLLQPLFRNYNALVTRLEELEQEHRSHAKSLEQEVRVATRALLEQQHSLSRAERLTATGELAASVAHELRNPLASVQMALRNLRRDVTDAELVRRVDLMNAELTRLSRLLGEILSKARHEPERPRTIRLADAVQQLLGLVRYQLPSQIVLESDVPGDLTCRLPEDSLRQALLNLILNAAQAIGDREGTIRIGARLDGEVLELSVVDDGTGFSEMILEDGGRPFSSTRDHGTGLGLAIVQRFAREVDGKVELANREPRGARVTLRLPCGRPHEGHDSADRG